MQLGCARIDNENARELLARGLAAIRAGEREIDLAGVTAIDSAAVALLLAWRREAQALRVELAVRNAPPALASLARLYGVDALLGLAEQGAGPGAGASA